MHRIPLPTRMAAFVMALPVLLAGPLLEAGEVFVYGHRGLNGEAPENTVPAFRACLRAGIGIEVDLHLTADGVPVVIHDASVERTSDGKGRIGDLTLDEVKRLDAGSWFGPEFRGERVPAFEEILRLIVREDPGGATRMILDHKETRPGAEAKAVDLLLRYGLVPRCIVLCKDHATLQRYKQAEASILTATIADHPDDLERVAALPFVDVVWVTRMFPGVPSAEDVAKIGHRGKRVLQFFATHDDERVRESVRHGIKHIVTDHPREAWRCVE